MTDLNTIEVHSRTITAFFESKEAAQKAIAHLEQAGIPSQHITLVPGNDTAYAATAGEPGFWESLKEMFLPDEDRQAYTEGLRRGGYLLAVKTDEANYDRVLDIVDVDGSVDMDEREAAWKSEGWTGYTAETTPMAAGTVAGATALSTAARERVVTPLAAPPAAPVATLGAGKDEAISLYEEKLQVGKRDVNHGRVRIRSYVVETPVSEQISLHSERVEIDRKAVDRPVNAADALFTDRVIEVEEHAEEAVIAKEVRVKEEVSLRKTADDKVQTVADTVRRTEVEIDDGRLQGTTGTRKFVATQDVGLIVEHMDVIASDGTKVGTVDHMDEPDKIKLARSTSPDGQHHYVPLAWVDHVDAHVHLNKAAADVKAGW